MKIKSLPYWLISGVIIFPVLIVLGLLFVLVSGGRINALYWMIIPSIIFEEAFKEVIKMLSENFPEDILKPTGKRGDVIQHVTFNNNQIGSILYECKKTEKFNNAFIQEVLRHQDTARAEFAVIVTHALKEGKSKFFIQEKVIVIDPLGLLDIALLLRNSLIEMHKLKLTKAEVKEKGVQILRYMQSGDFRNNMLDTIAKSRKAYEILVKEVKDHEKTWTERIKLYYSIHENTQNVRKSIGEIITGGTVNFEEYDFMRLDGSELPKLKSGNIGR